MLRHAASGDRMRVAVASWRALRQQAVLLLMVWRVLGRRLSVAVPEGIADAEGIPIARIEAITAAAVTVLLRRVSTRSILRRGAHLLVSVKEPRARRQQQ